MGEALIVRRGGSGGAFTKSTDISDSVVWNGGSSYGGFDAVLVIDPTKTYLAHLVEVEPDDRGDITSAISLLVSGGKIVSKVGGVHCDYGIVNNWLYATEGQYSYVDKLYVHLVE